MWCANCQADVAAEVTADNRRVCCAACGEEISSLSCLRPTTKTREARELLVRWSSERLHDPYGSLPGGGTPAGAPPAEPDFYEATRTIDSARERTAPAAHLFRVDAPHVRRASAEAAGGFPGHPHSAEQPRSAESPSAVDSRSYERPARTSRDSEIREHVHAAHAAVPPPHIDVQAAIGSHHRRKTDWVAFWGQCLAYAGVLGLTVGTSMVVWGHFGGPERYTPTGWLIATAGQMLLFLGVVTLVSSGMEHTTDEVARRIDRLGERLVRIEQTTEHALRGPHAPAGYLTGAAPRPTTEASLQRRA